ncbi:lipid-A-disaccharide synthase [Rubritalea marina]|uniref:lipid-A-disaccharide synthase n=1 Tax=Rubritalea marina TaxID=361055 RepID=UPI0012E99A74|nr:lipid-A-disaccharide synthase [Rubritalea marina]
MPEPASIYFIAGEVSGDTHGAELIHALLSQQPELQVHGTGGPMMQQASNGTVHDWVEDAAVMGIWEVLKQYSWFKQQFDQMLETIIEIKPSALVLIDYPGFNLRMAKAVRQALPNTKIIYYISPQVWAWNKKRIPVMAEVLDLMLCIFPFEKPIFEKAGLKTEFVGHPLVDELEEKRIEIERDPTLVGLFPGSREREVSRLFPVMLESARRLKIEHPELRFKAPAASAKLSTLMQQCIEQSDLPQGLIEISEGDSHSLMQHAGCGVIASGTATLEAAYFGLPYCLIYKIAWPSFMLGKLLVKIDFIGLVNILAGKQVVQEFIQSDADPTHIQSSLASFIESPEKVQALQLKLAETSQLLGERGCHNRAAKHILQEIGSTTA